jgi:hypothetical protein
MNESPSGYPTQTAVHWQGLPTNRQTPRTAMGWSFGTKRTASPAEEILADAVGWWDVSWYQDGDRILLNMGTARDLLNFRLGSTFATNTNEPLYIPVMEIGYVYFPGDANNTISCTAPATATSYAAYPLDGSSPTTGSVTGGAAFSFGTSGSWTKIDLLDSSSVVLTSFNADLVGLTASQGYPSPRLEQPIAVGGGTTNATFSQSGSSTLYTYTTTSAHGLSAGDTVLITGITPTVYNGVFVVNNITSSTVFVVSSTATLVPNTPPGAQTVSGTVSLLRPPMAAGAATSYTDNIYTPATTWTINRTTTVTARRTVLQPSLQNGGRPLFLLGVDDSLQIPAENRFQHTLTNIYQNEPYTALIFSRWWLVTNSSLVNFGKAPNNNSGTVQRRWLIGGTFTARNDDGISADGLNQYNYPGGYTPGYAFIMGFVNSDKFSVTTANIVYPSSIVGNRRSITNQDNNDFLRVGTVDQEFYAAAFFRRALSQAEIETICRYYGVIQTSYPYTRQSSYNLGV